ncbi:MAG: hypothetical protein H8E71_03000 [Candidatus Marinimicrobia bacterium]|nr:hypothetical protein [Candidatus Neomarinimicrobiota bacterium]
MDEIIKLFSKGYIRHLVHSNGLSSSIKGEDKENFNWIVDKNEYDIGSNHINGIILKNGLKRQG